MIKTTDSPGNAAIAGDDDVDDVELIDDAVDAELIEQLKTEGVQKGASCVQVCDLMTTGLSMREACQRSGIKHNTFLKCVSRSQTLSDHYTRARKILIDVRVDQMLAPIDYDQFRGDDGRVDNGAVQLFKTQQDNQKWAFSKIDPKRYGDRIDITATSEERRITRIEHVIVSEQPALPADCTPALESSEQNSEQKDAQG